MPGVVQWGIDELFAMLGKIRAGAEAERVTISENNGRLVALNARVQALPASANKTKMLAWISQSVRRQAEIAGTWRALSKRFADLSAQVSAWLKSVGIAPSAAGLSGLGELGAVWVVPVAIVALALVAWAAVAFIHERNQVQLKAIAFHEQAFNQLVKQGASTAELAAFVAGADKQTKALEPKGGDPLGGLGNAITALVIGAAVVMLLPTIMQAVRPRRTGA